MSVFKLVVVLCSCLCLADFSAGGETTNAQTPLSLSQGVVVEWVLPNYGADKAGLKPGDILLEWSSGNRRGQIASPFDLSYTRFEEASRATIKLEGLRNNETRSWFLGSDYWSIGVRPNFQGKLLSLYQEANDLAKAGKLAQALEHWRQASDPAEKFSVPWLGPWFVSHLAEVSNTQSWEEYDDAYREAIQEAGDASPVAKAELLKQWADEFRSRGDLANSEKRYEEATAEYRKLGFHTMAVSNALRNLGDIADLLGNLAKAEQCFGESLRIAEELAPGSIQLVWSLISLGALSQERGDLAGAESYYRKALGIEQAAFPKSSDLGLILQNLGALATARGDLAKAEDYYRRALVIAESFGPGSQYLPEILSHLATCVLDRGNAGAAEKYEQQALAVLQKQTPNSLDVAFSLANLGRIARVRGNLGQAQEFYNRALTIGEKFNPPPSSVARILIGSGYVARDRGDFHEAEEYFRRALGILEKAPLSRLNHADTLADLANALRNQNHLDAAAQLYQEALAELETETLHLGGVEEDRSRYRAKHDLAYREYVDVLMERGHQELAFQVLEGSRARTLLEIVSRANIDVRAGVDPALLERERGLQQSRNSKSAYRLRLLSGKHTEQQLATLDGEIRDLLDQDQEVESEIRAKSPGYAALTQPQPLNMKEIQHLLDADTLLLEYSLGEPRSYVWAVSDRSLVAYELPKRNEIETAARHVYELLDARNFGMGSKGSTQAQMEARWARMDREYPKAAMDLSRMVLGPVAALLKGKRLLIVSDGALQHVPFAALPVPEVASSEKSKITYPKNASLVPLIVDHEIVSLPSASVLAELRRQAMGRPEAPKAVAVLADPVFTSTDERVDIRHRRNQNDAKPGPHLPAIVKASQSADQLTRSLTDVAGAKNERFYLKRLLFTRHEAEAIMSVTPGSKGRMKALDFQANRTTATSADLGQYRIVHFATHGLLNNEHPELSGLVLSLVNNRGQPQDGFLELEDIYNLRLPVDLVVLSACDTALGQEMNGEGLVGLTRGFMYAGATRVVASLWSVNDAATSELMARFYKEMQQGQMKPAAALRAAQIQMWKQKIWTSPYYWAAFQIQGDWR